MINLQNVKCMPSMIYFSSLVVFSVSFIAGLFAVLFISTNCFPSPSQSFGYCRSQLRAMQRRAVRKGKSKDGSIETVAVREGKVYKPVGDNAPDLTVELSLSPPPPLFPRVCSFLIFFNISCDLMSLFLSVFIVLPTTLYLLRSVHLENDF